MRAKLNCGRKPENVNKRRYVCECDADAHEQKLGGGKDEGGGGGGVGAEFTLNRFAQFFPL